MEETYLLDTNIASSIIRADSAAVEQKIKSIPMSAIKISAITEAELRRGVAKKPEAKHLPIVVEEFLLRVDILPWGSSAAKAYAELRTACEKLGKSLSVMDMLIAAHSVAEKSILVTNDKAFFQLERLLNLQNWMKS